MRMTRFTPSVTVREDFFRVSPELDIEIPASPSPLVIHLPLNHPFLRGISMRKFIRFLKEEDGPTAVEYAVMLALIMGVIIGSVALSGQALRDSWNDTATRLQSAYGQ